MLIETYWMNVVIITRLCLGCQVKPHCACTKLNAGGSSRRNHHRPDPDAPSVRGVLLLRHGLPVIRRGGETAPCSLCKILSCCPDGAGVGPAGSCSSPPGDSAPSSTKATTLSRASHLVPPAGRATLVGFRPVKGPSPPHRPRIRARGYLQEQVSRWARGRTTSDLYEVVVWA